MTGSSGFGPSGVPRVSVCVRRAGCVCSSIATGSAHRTHSIGYPESPTPGLLKTNGWIGSRSSGQTAGVARSRSGQFALMCVGRWDTASGVVPKTAPFLRCSSGPGMPWLGRESGVPCSFGSGSLVFRCSHVRFAQRVLFVAVLARQSGVPEFLPPLVCVPFELAGLCLDGCIGGFYRCTLGDEEAGDGEDRELFEVVLARGHARDLQP